MPTEATIRRLAWTAIVAAVAVSSLTLAALTVPSVRSWFAGATPVDPSYAIGESIDVPSDVYSAHSATLLVFASDSCVVCRQSRPSLLKLAAALETRTEAGVALFMSATRSDQGRDFARSVGLINGLKLVDVAQLRVKRVPTLVVVNSSGTVTYASQGLVTEEVTQKVLEKIAGLQEQGD